MEQEIEKRQIRLSVRVTELIHWDESGHQFILPKGKLKLGIGASSVDIRLNPVVELL